MKKTIAILVEEYTKTQAIAFATFLDENEYILLNTGSVWSKTEQHVAEWADELYEAFINQQT